MFAAALLFAVLTVACDGESGDAPASPTSDATILASDTASPTRVVAQSPSPSPSTTPAAPTVPTVRAPYEVELDPGAELSLSPAVVSVDPNGAGSTAWILPNTAVREFQVSPDGRLIFWTELVRASVREREELANALFDDIAPHLDPAERDAIRADILRLAVDRSPDDRNWLQVVTRLDEQLHGRLPRGTDLKDRLLKIGQSQPVGQRNHLLRTDDATDELRDWSPVAFGSHGSGILARRDSSSGDGTLILLDRDGQYLRDAPYGGRVGESLAWSPTGEVIASIVHRDQPTDRAFSHNLVIWPASADSDLKEIETPIGHDAPVAVSWSEDGSRLAVATEERILAFDAVGSLLWEQAGDFETARNLAFSSDGALHVHTTLVEGNAVSPLTYVFAGGGELLFRVHGLETCAGEPWFVATEELHDGSNVVSLAGDVSALTEVRRRAITSPFTPRVTLTWSPDANGMLSLVRIDGGSSVVLISLAPDVELDRLSGRRNPWSEDGRYVFATPPVARDGCAIIWTASADPPVVEYPPFDE